MRLRGYGDLLRFKLNEEHHTQYNDRILFPNLSFTSAYSPMISQIFFNTKADCLLMTTSQPSISTFPCNLSPKSRKKRQLIVEINIVKTGAHKFIHLSDIHDVNNIDDEIYKFIQVNFLKQAAFGFIKDVIYRQINQHKQQQCSQCHSTPPCNCSCYKKTTPKNNYKRQFFDATFSNGLSSKSSAFQQTLKKQPHQVTIKITPKIDPKTIKTKHEEASSFVFNSQFTLPSSVGEKERFFLTDQLYQNVLESSQACSSAYFSSMSQFRSKQRGKENKIIIKINDISMKRPTGKSVKLKQPTANKNSHLLMKTPLKIKTNSLISQDQTPLRVNSNNRLSTKQRKTALMTPQKSKVKHANTSQVIHLDSDKLQSMVLQHKKFLKQAVQRQIQAPYLPHQTTHQALTPQFDSTLCLLFQKLTTHNPPYLLQIHSQYVSYQLLSRQQLHFMGLLFQRIDHKELNHLNYAIFRANSLKHCRRQLQDLVSSYRRQKRGSL